jgi:glycosyltransferase involved in cell wall biosynthesis
MNVGGPAILIDGIIQGLPREDFNHHLITGSCAQNEIDYLDAHPNLEKLIAIHKLKSMRRAILPYRDFQTLIETIRLIREIKPDIIHTHTSKAGIIGRIAGKIAAPQATVIHTYHGHLLYGYFSTFRTKLIIQIERYLSKITDVLIAVTSQIECDLRNVGIGRNCRWEVIHPGVKEVTHKGMNDLRNREKKLIWIGRFTGIKNPKLAIEIMKSISELGGSDISLTMVGDGELLDTMKVLAVANKLPIEFIGWQTDVYHFLSSSDALLITSKNEGLPIVMLEAASMGIPTFSTKVGGTSEFIEDKLTGFFVDNNPDMAAANIFNTLQNDQVINIVGRSAREKYQNGFSMESYVKSHYKLYKTLTSSTF